MIQVVAHFIHSYENLYPRSAKINDSNTYVFQRNIMWKNLYDRMYKYIYMWENIFKVSSFFAPCWIHNAYYSSGSRTVIEKKRISNGFVLANQGELVNFYWVLFANEIQRSS